MEGDLYKLRQIGVDVISIHALRVEGDRRIGVDVEKWTAISIHALRVEGDAHAVGVITHNRPFLSTPSGWRATAICAARPMECRISIHALRVEGDLINIFMF